MTGVELRDAATVLIIRDGEPDAAGDALEVCMLRRNLESDFVGAWLMKAQGRGVLSRIQRSLRDGRMPTKELVDGGLILFAGALMLTPGFLTDILGFILLIPPSRAVVRAALMRRFRGRLGVGYAFLARPGGRDSVYDTTGREQGQRHELP